MYYFQPIRELGKQGSVSTGAERIPSNRAPAKLDVDQTTKQYVILEYYSTGKERQCLMSKLTYSTRTPVNIGLIDV